MKRLMYIPLIALAMMVAPAHAQTPEEMFGSFMGMIVDEVVKEEQPKQKPRVEQVTPTMKKHYDEDGDVITRSYNDQNFQDGDKVYRVGNTFVSESDYRSIHQDNYELMKKELAGTDFIVEQDVMGRAIVRRKDESSWRYAVVEYMNMPVPDRDLPPSLHNPTTETVAEAPQKKRECSKFMLINDHVNKPDFITDLSRYTALRNLYNVTADGVVTEEMIESYAHNIKRYRDILVKYDDRGIGYDTMEADPRKVDNAYRYYTEKINPDNPFDLDFIEDMREKAKRYIQNASSGSLYSAEKRYLDCLKRNK